MTEYRFEVSAEEVGCRLDAFLARRFPLLSQTKLRSLIASGAATFAGNTLSIGRRLKPDDAIEFRFDPARTPCCYPEGIPLEVLREDPCFVVVNKPAGMLVHPTKGVKRGTLTNRLLAYLNPRLTSVEVRPEGGEPTLWPRFVHRLDRETSGVILVAKDSASAGSLGNALASGQFAKSYLAILCGHLGHQRYEVREPIRRHDDAPPHWRAGADGQSACSIVEPLATCGESLTLCRMQPVTGRTNQLRIHAACLDTPILGDVFYGGVAAGRLMLHAWSLAFPHPTSGETVSVSAPVPQVFREAWPDEWPVLVEP